IDIHRRLDSQRTIGLQRTFFHSGGHLGFSITDVNLSAVDVKWTTIQRGGFGQASDGMFGSGIRPSVRTRGMGGNRAIVDDTSSAWILLLHDFEGLLSAKKSSGHAGIQYGTPLFIRQVFERERGRTQSRIVE